MPDSWVIESENSMTLLEEGCSEHQELSMCRNPPSSNFYSD